MFSSIEFESHQLKKKEKKKWSNVSEKKSLGTSTGNLLRYESRSAYREKANSSQFQGLFPSFIRNCGRAFDAIRNRLLATTPFTQNRKPFFFK